MQSKMPNPMASAVKGAGAIAPPRPQPPPILPTQEVSAVQDLKDYKILVHSLSGVGKTCFGQSIPNFLTIDTERGTLAHSGMIVRLGEGYNSPWEHFAAVISALSQGRHNFDGVVIDTLDGLYNHAWSHVLKSMTITHPSEAASGKGWERITSTMFDQLTRLQLSGLGIVCTAHTNIGTLKLLNAAEITVFQPSFVGGSARSAYQRVIDFFDLIGFIHVQSMVKPPSILGKAGKLVSDVRAMPTGSLVEEEVRVLDFGSSQFWITKDRSGRLGQTIILPSDWREDWSTLEARWVESGIKEMEAEQPEESAVPTPNQGV